MAADDRKQIDRRSFLKAAGGAGATVALAGCTGGDGEQTTTAGSDGTTSGEQTTADEETETDAGENSILTYARGSDSGSLDFQNSTSGEVAKVTNQLYDGLIQFKPGTTELTGALATEYGIDGKTVSLTLREGVQFHDGESFTAEDFVATYRRFTDEEYEHFAGNDYRSAYGEYSLGSWIDSVSADGEYSVTITLKQQYAPMLRNLAMFCSKVHSKKAIVERGSELKSKPVGTGAFEFDNWDQSNGRIRLTKNDSYWGETPKVDEVVFTTVGKNSTRAQTLDTGGADIIDGLGAQSSKQVESSNNAELVSEPGINVGYMAFNMAKREEFRNKKVRQAVSYAINTKAIVQTIFQGIASEASQPVPDSVMGYNEELDPYPHDPEKAQQLLNEAGYGDGFSFELATFKNPRTYNPSPLQAAQTVKSNLNEVGLTVDINQQPFDPFLEYTDTGKHDACFLGWMTDNADPDNFFYALLHPGVSQDEVPDGQDWVSFDTENFNSLNAAAWANTDYMQLVEDAQTTYDTGTRAEKYKEAAKIFHEQAPWVAMNHAKEQRGVHNRVSGFEIAPIGGPYLNLVSVN